MSKVEKKCISCELGLIIILLAIINPISEIIPYSMQTNKTIDHNLNPYLLLANLNKTSFDDEFNGYLSEVDDDLNILNENKLISDHYVLAEAYLRLVEQEKNNSYQKFSLYLLNLLEKFKLESGGYTTWLSQSLEVESSNLISFECTAALIRVYTHFYKWFGNYSYLSQALELVSFIETHFYDQEHGGFFKNLYGETSLPATNYRRVTGDYGSYITSLLDLYELSGNFSHLKRANEILNETIGATWNNEIGYFYPRLYNTNEPDLSDTAFYLHEQLNLAISLFRCSKYSQHDYFQEFALSIINMALKYGRTTEGYFIHSFYSNGSYRNSDLYISRQWHVFNALIQMVNCGIHLSEEQQEILNLSDEVLIAFLSKNNGVFFRSPAKRIISPWVNGGGVLAILNLNKYFEEIHQDYQEITPGLTIFLIILTFTLLPIFNPRKRR